MHYLLIEKKPLLDKAVDHAKQEMASIRTGRASTAIVDGLKATVYGAEQEIKNIATISVPDSQTVQIEPWDEGSVKDIEKAIQESSLGINPNVAGKIIRLSIPPLTEETRKSLIKVVNTKIEEGKIAIRNIREDIRKEIEKQEKADEISEDERYQLQEELDQMVKEINTKIEEIGKQKEKQILTV